MTLKSHNSGMLINSQFAKDITVARRILKQLDISLSKMEGLIEKEDRDGMILESFNCEKLAERLCNVSRLLPVATGKPKIINDVNKIILEENTVDICYTEEGWFKATIPSLLPKKEKGDPSWIRATLHAGMDEFFSKNEKQLIREDSIMIFRHCYSKERTYRDYRDHDNIELNAVVDMITLYVLVDDSPMRLKHFYCSAIEEIDKTEVFVVPVKDFSKWLTKYNIGGEEK